jgi:hypothetical protein
MEVGISKVEMLNVSVEFSVVVSAGMVNSSDSSDSELDSVCAATLVSVVSSIVVKSVVNFV